MVHRLGIAAGVPVAHFSRWLVAHIALRRSMRSNGFRSAIPAEAWLHNVRLTAVVISRPALGRSF